MSFEHPAFRPAKPSEEASEQSDRQASQHVSSEGLEERELLQEVGESSEAVLDAELIDSVEWPAAHNPSQHIPHIPYTPKGFLDIYEEAKHLRKHSGKVAAAFIMVFLVLYGAGSYAGIVEAKRMNPLNWEAFSDTAHYGSQIIRLDRTAAEAPTFFERFGLKIMAALGSIGFFVFAASAVAEISFRSYEGRDLETYDVLDSLSKNQGTKLLRLGFFFMTLLLAVGVVEIALTIDPGVSRYPFFVIVVLLAQYYILLRTIFAVHSMIGEDLSPIEALHRSWDLTDGNILWLIWWGIIFGFLFFVVTFFLYLLPAGIVSVIIAGMFFDSPEAMVEVMGVLMLFILPFLARQVSLLFFFQMTLYRELRLRYDGIDPDQPKPETISVVT